MPLPEALRIAILKNTLQTFGRLSKRTSPEVSFCSAVIAAAGSSRRCNGEDKLLYKINGKPILAYTIEVFEKCGSIKEIIVVTRAQQLEVISEMCARHRYAKVSKIIEGGTTRTVSVYNGVFAVSKKAKFIAVHDGARPFIDAAVIDNTLKAAAGCLAAAPGIPVISTIKKAETSDSRSRVIRITQTIDRKKLYEIQTPQIFRTEIIKAALTKAVRESAELTDDCMAVEKLGIPVYITEGTRSNIKITEHGDLMIAEALLTKGIL